jgi:hypothetical protein
MSKILYTILITLLLVGACSAAELQEDRLFACGKTFEISPELQPSALMAATAAEFDAKRFDLVYRRFVQLFESTLLTAEKNEPDVSKFIIGITRTKDLEAKYYNVSHNPIRKEEVFFSATGNEILVKCDSIPSHFADMAAVSLMTRWVRGQEILPELKQRSSFVAHQSLAHEALLYSGLPMWPWELWANGKRLGKDDWEPLFKTQLVLMRPTAGVGIDTRNGIAGNLNVSVGIEPLGFVRYQSDKYNAWWGASLLVTSSTSSGTGVGGLLRWNNYVLGMTHHEANLTGEPAGNYVFVGVELYDMFNKKRDDFNEWKQLQQKRVSDLMSQVH